jgi:hypothetical protein
VSLSRLAQLDAFHTGFDPGRSGVGIDLDPAHARGLDQQRVVEWTERRRPVPGALSGDPQALVGREADRRRDVVGSRDERDRDGVLVGDQVPGVPGIVPVGVFRGDDPAVDREL